MLWPTSSNFSPSAAVDHLLRKRLGRDQMCFACILLGQQPILFRTSARVSAPRACGLSVLLGHPPAVEHSARELQSAADSGTLSCRPSQPADRPLALRISFSQRLERCSAAAHWRALPVIALMYWSKKFCEMLVPLTVATAGSCPPRGEATVGLGLARRQADQARQQEDSRVIHASFSQ